MPSHCRRSPFLGPHPVLLTERDRLPTAVESFVV